MLRRKSTLILLAPVVIAGLWSSINWLPTSLAAGGRKPVRITVVGPDERSLAAVRVQVSLDGEKPLSSSRVSKNTWLVADAPEKFSLTVRDGRAGGTVDLRVPPVSGDVVRVTAKVDASGLQVEVTNALPNGDAPPKLDPHSSRLLRSAATAFSEVVNPRPTKQTSLDRSNSVARGAAFSGNRQPADDGKPAWHNTHPGTLRGVCAGETCASAAPIASLPFTGSGNSCDCANDYDSVCPYSGSTSQDAVYKYMPTQEVCVAISLCNGSAYDTKVYVYENTCGGAAVACNDDNCSSPNFPFGPYVSSLANVHMTAGNTYYVVVDGYDGDCGNYVLNVTQVACPAPCGVCPSGGTPENEANCGLPTDNVDGGCLSSPEVFKPVACGQEYCGTAAFDGTTRDTDWFEVTVGAGTQFTWTVTGEFDGLIGLVETVPPGSPNCANTTGFVNPAGFPARCDTGVVTTACMPPGTYRFVVLPQFNDPVPCGAKYTARLDCSACTPPTCQGDTCATAQVIAAVPFSDTGDSCLCNDDYDEICPYDAAGAPDKVYVYTPTQDECVDITMCAGSAYDTKIYVYQNTCGAYQSGSQIACNDDDCSSPLFADYVSSLSGVNLLAGNTYYIVVDGYLGFGDECGTYTIDIGPCAPPCDVTCGPTSTPENEPNCGLPDDPTNGGCITDTINPPTSLLACGQEYCGTSAFDGATRDTDWYQVTVATSTQFTWTVNGEFDSLMGLVETVPAGSPNCADTTGFVNPAGFPLACVPGAVVTECLPPGVYRFFVAPVFADPVVCGKEYTAKLDCLPCVIPLGACCRGDGSCSENVAESQCPAPGTWQGENTSCANVVCPQPPGNDDCGDAFTVGVPSTTAGSNALSNPESGLPATCGPSITPGVWYSVMGTGETITITTCSPGTNYDTMLSVFCPNCSAPACVGGNDDQEGSFDPACDSLGNGFNRASTFSWCSAAGETYLILVDGFGGDTGSFDLVVSDDGLLCSNPPSCIVTGPCPGPGDCCVANPGTVGCSDETCCNTVCGCDPFCCATEWDVNCAGPNAFVPGCSALDHCPACQGGGGGSGGCCLPGGCTVLSSTDCATAGGQYLGDNTDCSSGAGTPTTYESDVNLPIADGDPAQPTVHTINVADSYAIGDVNVDLRITHTWIGDLTVTVEHNGTTVIIVDQPGVPASTFGCPSNDLDVVLDGAGSGGPIETLCAGDGDPTPTSPPNYVPNNPLSAFDGMNASGAWTITVWDNAAADTGTLDHWSLHIDRQGPSPCIPTGACCTSQTACQLTTQAACTGVYLGDGTSCVAGGGPTSNYQHDANMAIPDGGGPGNAATDSITVSDSITIADLNVDVVATHTWVGDLIVTIEHNGTSVTIVNQAGVPASTFGCSSNDYDIVLDDEGTGGSIENNCATDSTPTPTSPPNYVPNNPLSAFDGMNASGTWNINVSDNAAADTGTLVRWSLHILQAGPSPCSNTCFPNCTGRVCGDDGCGGSCGTCNDSVPCTTDACSPAGQCVFTPNNAACSDGLACNGVETCNASTGCVAGTPVNCNDNVACTADACTEPSGACTHTPSDSLCDDGLYCNGAETCTASGCVGGTPPCDATQTCDEATDTCNDSGFTPIPTVSQWGVVVLSLLLLTTAKIYFGRRQVAA